MKKRTLLLILLPMICMFKTISNIYWYVPPHQVQVAYNSNGLYGGVIWNYVANF